MATIDPPDDESPQPGVSRRRLFTSAGLAAAGGAVIAAAGPVASAGASTSSNVIGTASPGGTAVEFRGRIVQTGAAGESFASNGFLISATGAPSSGLFSEATQAVGTALLTAHATGELVARVLDTSVHSLDISGEMTVYQRDEPGADFADPGSFEVGAVVARYTMTLQDVLTVFAPGKGLPVLAGDMKQTYAGTLTGPLTGLRLGFRGQRLRLAASGLGTLVDPVTLNAELEIAGSWVTE